MPSSLKVVTYVNKRPLCFYILAENYLAIEIKILLYTHVPSHFELSTNLLHLLIDAGKTRYPYREKNL